MPKLQSLRKERAGWRVRDYAGRLAWIASDGWSLFRWRIVAVVAANAVGVAGAFVCLAGLFLYVKQSQLGQPFRIPWAGLNLAGDAVLFAAGLLLLSLLSAISLYRGERRIHDLTRIYERHCLSRLFRIIADPGCRGWLPSPARESLARLSRIGVRWTAFALRDLLRLILPAFALLAATLYLLLADAALALLLLPLPVLYLLPLYALNRGVSARHRQFAAANNQARRSLNGILKWLLEQGIPPAERVERSRDALERTGYDQAMEHYYARLLAPAQVQLLNSVFLAVCLCVLLIYFGTPDSGSGRAWADLLASLLAVRFAMGGLRPITAILIKLSRFQPEYRAYSEFVRRSDGLRAQGHPAAFTEPPTSRAAGAKGGAFR
ncbi:MAG: hypothetical protein V3T83_10365 [Acidobacteriota bacterium]